MIDAEMVPVTQAARDAAAAHVEWEHKAQQEWDADWPQFFASDFPVSCRKGVWDNHPVVQAFARAMLAAEAAAIEKVAEWHDQQACQYRAWAAESNAPDSVLSKHVERAKSHDLHATAIRSLKEGASHVG